MATPESKFPRYPDGDVLVTFPDGRVYQLHAVVLRRNSTKLAELLAKDNGAALTAQAKKNGVVIQYRIDLVLLGDKTAEYVAREVDSHGRTARGVLMPDIGNGKVVNELYKHHDNLLRVFYNERPEFNEDKITTVVRDCMGMVGVAESLGSVQTITESVDNALLRQGQFLFRSIANNPITWANVACRIRSTTICKETVIHTVGRWAEYGEAELKELHHPAMLEICNRKYNELEIRKRAIEVRILGHYPRSLHTMPLDGQRSVSRTHYANHIYPWMVLSLFRQWFTQAVCEGRGSNWSDGGAALYRQIGKGGYAYLDRRAMASFHAMFPMSKKALTIIENHLTDFKDSIKPLVATLVVNNSQLSIGQYPVEYLTCAAVAPGEYPWLQQQPLEASDDMIMLG